MGQMARWIFCFVIPTTSDKSVQQRISDKGVISSSTYPVLDFSVNRSPEGAPVMRLFCLSSSSLASACCLGYDTPAYDGRCGFQIPYYEAVPRHLDRRGYRIQAFFVSDLGLAPLRRAIQPVHLDRHSRQFALPCYKVRVPTTFECNAIEVAFPSIRLFT